MYKLHSFLIYLYPGTPATATNLAVLLYVSDSTYTTVQQCTLLYTVVHPEAHRTHTSCSVLFVIYCNL
jgi:hypothetical protein